MTPQPTTGSETTEDTSSAPDAGATEAEVQAVEEDGNDAEAEPVEETADSEEPEVVDIDGIELLDPEEDPRIAELEKSLSELQARLRAVSAAYKQQQEDMAAARERLKRQAALKEEVRRGEVVATLFDPVQNLQRSVDAAKKGSTMEDMIQGLEMLQHQFMEAFATLGLEEVPGKGSRFNPNLHEALTMVPVEDPALDDVVIDVFSAGYRIGARLITPARVIVGQLVAQEVEPESPDEDGGDSTVAEDTRDDSPEPTPADEGEDGES
jgi:molecular chaperone GrpE